jgi:CMP/dCMP kinase
VIIAIDGPAGSGKSTTAQAVAEELDYLYIDTGAMYRAFGLACHRADPSLEFEACREVLKDLAIELHVSAEGLRVWMDGEDVSDAIRHPEAGEWASTVSAWPEVRERLVAQQRRIAEHSVSSGRGVVLDGRDIGTVVFPEAPLKIFMEAPPRVRAERRVAQLAERGIEVAVKSVQEDIIARDRRDREREHAPLREADDAIRLDTGEMRFEEQVAFVVDLARERER